MSNIVKIERWSCRNNDEPQIIIRKNTMDLLSFPSCLLDNGEFIDKMNTLRAEMMNLLDYYLKEHEMHEHDVYIKQLIEQMEIDSDE